MADANKTKITVKKTIKILSEAKGEPAWFAARPEAKKALKDLTFERKMELDTRKWKPKVIEDGIYAVARYDLKLFATILSGLEKDILKARPKERQKAKFVKNDKAETKEEAAALDKALDQLKKNYAKTSKEISDKVSLALDDVESDKGDNKRALAAGKKAVEQFRELNTGKLFEKPVGEVEKLLKELSANLKKSGDADPAALKKAKASLETSRKGFQATAKTAQNAVNFLLKEGARIAKDKKADPGLQEVGKLILSSKVKNELHAVSENVEHFEEELESIAKFIKDEKPSSDDAARVAKQFRDQNKHLDGDLKDAVKIGKQVSDAYNKAVKNIKK